MKEYKTVQFGRCERQTQGCSRITWLEVPMARSGGFCVTILGPLIVNSPGTLLTQAFGGTNWNVVTMSMNSDGNLMTVLLERQTG